MKLVLLSGGSGKRLWPLSNDARSKQFLKVLENEDLEMESMVQRVWGQIKAAGLDQSTLIATSSKQVEILQNQLGPVPIIAEPERRDTFPAIALAASYLYSLKGVSLDETVCILPVDPYVEDHFFEKIKELEQVLENTDAGIALMGVTPTYPSSKYGYIIPEKTSTANGVMRAAGFTEKPTEERAEELMAEQALWNCGVFAFKLGYMIDKLFQSKIPVQYEELNKKYSQLPKISFDYEVVEKEKHIAVLPYEGCWKDLGTWNTLTENMGVQQIGEGRISEDCDNTHLINELDIPVTVIGLSNAVVAVSPDGILVSDKSASPRVKDMVAPDQQPMYEERSWGWYRVLDYTKYEQEEEVLTRRICLWEGKCLSYQKHCQRSTTLNIVSGEGVLVFNDEVFDIKSGDVFTIPSHVYYGIKADSDVEFIEVQKGSVLQEDDIIEMYSTWEEVEAHCSARKIPS
ncbi:mannose-1-phosphate guanylyltransferase [Paenibacillus sp. F411]|uniref:Mannose-6-phosphate isomerase n=1 Tax=Paenibacillus algicola TaxID=2565926 RepID=A0A4P8XKU2_9BACL|nr:MULTISPECIES: sugar phosphate nucleotidyltransferase [Paenibacillus]MBO2944237.1 mannose-1-phosphate guanylyltransferase [Paenibacillus sp. F411]QCT03048.1 mannose-6-phosphate isomerase [Paenibacillus algicola]